MTTNQTIDGVPRELLSIYLGEIKGNRHDAGEKLRALLDAPIPFPGYPPVPEDRKLPAAQPQGEPMAWMDPRSPEMHATISNEVKQHNLKFGGAPSAAVNGYSIPLYAEQPAPFQSRVNPWILECFGEAISADRQERNHRFLEEALELVQANHCTASEAHQLVDYVYSRPVGEPSQEVGGVMVTLAALCLATGIDMHAAGETELARIWTKVDQIRAKQAAKPAMSPLPGVYPDRDQPAPVAVDDNVEFEKWWMSTPILRKQKIQIAQEAWFARANLSK